MDRHKRPGGYVRKLSAGLLAGLLLVVGTGGLKAGADTTVQGFSSSGSLEPGWVVALVKDASQTVKAAPATDTTQIYGVVVDPSDAPFTLNNLNDQVFVATGGDYDVLVSTSNGAIKSGDYISMSNIDGIAAKATDSQSTILGRAQATFSGTSNVITSSSGAAIGRIKVNIAIGENPLASDRQVPAFLRKLGNSVAGKQVAVVRLYSALGIFLISVLCALAVLWTGIRTSLEALGRNPLSRHAILSGLYKVIFAGMGIFIIGLAGVYLLLRV